MNTKLPLTELPKGNAKGLLSFPLNLDLEKIDAHIAILGVPYGLPYYPSEMANDQSRAPDILRQNAQDAAWDEPRTLYHFDWDLGGPLIDNKDIKIVDCGNDMGCTDSLAMNFDPLVEFDDNSCIYAAYGCMDPYSFNFDPTANVNQISEENLSDPCIEIVNGCTILESINFNELVHKPTKVMGYPATQNVVSSSLGIILTGFVLAVEGFSGSDIVYDSMGWFNF